MRLQLTIHVATLLLGGFLLTTAAIGCGFWFASHANHHAALGGLIAGYAGSIIFAVLNHVASGFRPKVTWGALSAACWVFALTITSSHEELATLNVLGMVVWLLVIGSLGAVQRHRIQRSAPSRPTPL